MQDTQIQPRTSAAGVAGILLVGIGIAALGLRQAGVDFDDVVAAIGWPSFIIVPGIALLAIGLVTPPPRGIGLSVPGSIVTTVGAILLYQQATGHWESWSYAWALIPGGAGLGTILYGLLHRQRDDLANGLRLVLISSVVFAGGMWFFETTFATGRAPFDLSMWWPVVLIGVGVLVMLNSVVRSGFDGTRSLVDDVPPRGGNR